MAKPSNDLIAKLTRLAQASGDEEVKTWVACHLANDIVAGKRATGRPRGVKVKLLGGRANAVLNEQRISTLISAYLRSRKDLTA